ncbi:MAG: ATP-grasp domain-containing protein, partial [Cytophagales bacterium]|nr:ATP-grasp domain-containing protein [Cytophagales bacterium]
MRKKLNIGVTGLNAIDSPGPGVPVIRALRDSKDFDVHIIGLSYDTLEPGIYMHDLVDKTYQIPLPTAGQETLFQRLAYIQEQENLDILIPNFDAELFSFIKMEERLKKELNIQMFLPTIEQFESRQKINLNTFGEKHGIQVPKSFTIFSTHEIQGLLDKVSYPMVIKGKFYDAAIAYNHEQAVNYFNKTSAKWGLPIIVQEFIYGTEVNVTAIGDGKGRTIGAVPMRKLYITDKGKAWAGVCLDDPKLLEITNKMIQSCQWKGGFELEFMKTKDDEYYLMEINPRFPAWVYLAVGAGQNHPEALVKMALG